MLVLSLVNILETAAADQSEKNYSGYVQDPDQLFTERNLAKLEEQHKGVFAFIAFHPKIDGVITEYLTAGSLGADAGDHVFALFTLDSPANTPQSLSTTAFQDWVKIDSGRYPAYDFVRNLFVDRPAPPLPGIILIEKFTGQAEPVFVSLEGVKTAAEVRTMCQRVFYIASESYLSSKEKPSGQFASNLSTRLASQGLVYYRGEQTSMREWLIAALRLAWSNAGTLVSIVQLFV